MCTKSPVPVRAIRSAVSRNLYAGEAVPDVQRTAAIDLKHGKV